MCRVKSCKNNDNYIHNFCKECFEKYPFTFNKENALEYKKIYIKSCEMHGKFISASTFSKCPICLNEINEFNLKFSELSDELMNSIINSGVFKVKETYEGKWSKWICLDTAFGDRYFKKCTECGKWIMILDHINRSLEAIENGSKIFCYGQVCFNKWMHKNKAFKYSCNICEEPLINPSQICPKCGNNPHRIKEYKCKNCGNKLKNALEKCQCCGYRIETKFPCPNCNEVLSNPNIKCHKCGYSLTQEMLNFNLNIKCNVKCKDWSACNIKSDNSIYKNKFGYCTNSSSIWSKMPNFKKYGDEIYYLDKSNKQYIPWSEFKSKFERKRNTKSVETFIDKLISLDIFQPKCMGPAGSYDLNDTIKMHTTFRTQESDSWSGARSAFEKSLVESNVEWFCYVKFYVDPNGNPRPLVVGKSGSQLVNAGGSDISFSEDVNDGPARRFLNEGNLYWDKTQILIIKAKSEQQALYYEWYISKTFNLFES